MTLSPLKREHSLAVRQPNPMWTFASDERRLLEDLLLPLKTEDGRPFLYGAADCWDERLHIGLSNIRGLSGLDFLNPKRAIISIHRETTIDDFCYIDMDGQMVRRNKEGDQARQYFDGFSFSETELGHITSACVDFDVKKIWVQDSQGITIKPEVAETFKETFPDFEYTDLMLWQQRDAHSCGILTLYNMECFARGEMPEENVDTIALRARYAAILDNYELAESIAPQPNRYYDRPIYRLRYVPI